MMNKTPSQPGWKAKVKRHPFLWLGGAVLVVLMLGLVLAEPLADKEPETAYYTATKGDFLVTIVEGGTLQAVNEVVIRNEVEGSSQISYLVPEGSFVTNGQLLVELDTGEATEKVNQQEISYERAKSDYIGAEKNLEIQRSVTQSQIDAAELKVEFAQIDLDKFQKGQMLQELRNAEIEITTATSDLLLSKENLEWSEKLYAQGFETENNVKQGQNNVQDLTLRLEKAQTNLWVLQNFDHPKMLRQYESSLSEARKELERTIAQGDGKLEQLRADLITQSNSLDLIRRKLENDTEQLEKSKIFAPQDGLVVYAISEGRFSSQSMIEQGASVRHRQDLIKLPDTSLMKVEIKVHESQVNKVRAGQAAFVVLDPLPDQRFRAEVSKVGILPDTQARFGNPNLKVYKTEVVLRDKLPDIKPGVSARAEIVVTNIPNAVTVPIQAVTTLKGKPVVYAKRPGGPEPVPVQVGMFNSKFIEITSGVQAGDEVMLSPPFDTQAKDLGGAVIEKNEQLPESDLAPRPVTTPNGQEPGLSPRAWPAGPGEPGGASPRGGERGSDDRRSNEQRPSFNREEMMKRFDKNGDGELDEEERNALRQEMQSRFGSGPGGGGGGERRARGSGEGPGGGERSGRSRSGDGPPGEPNQP